MTTQHPYRNTVACSAAGPAYRHRKLSLGASKLSSGSGTLAGLAALLTMKSFVKKAFGNTQLVQYSVLVALALSGLLSAGSIANANTLYVATTGNDSAPGSADAPFQTLRQAIAKARSGDTILVGPGTYSGQYNTNLPGSNVTLKSQQGAASTVIDGGGTATAFWLNNTSLTHACLIDGFTIQNAYNNGVIGSSAPATGGAMLIAGSSPTIQNCVFKNCHVGGNWTGGGGALCISSASPYIINCIFENCATDTTSTLGGAILIQSSSNVAIYACSFHGCSSLRGGGALQVGCDWVHGNDPSTVQVTNCTFRENSTPNAGGAMEVQDGATATIKATAFLGNYGTGAGGAIEVEASTLQVGSSSFVNNSSDFEGGAVDGSQSNITLTHCSIVNNIGACFGGGISVYGGSLNIVNSILCGNEEPANPSSCPIYNSRGSVMVIYSDMQGGYTGRGNIDADPRFVQEPGTPNALYGDLHLQSGSPCLDAGTAQVNLPSVDLDVNPRVFGPAPDMGAYEMQPTSRFNNQTYYEIVNLYSGLALDDFGFQHTNGAWVDQYPYVGQTNQQWQIIRVTGGYCIVNRASGLVLEDHGLSTQNGGIIDQWQWTGGSNSNELWSLSYQGAAIYKLFNVYSGLLLEDPGNSTTGSTLLDQWSDVGGDNLNQQWVIIPVGNVFN